MHFPPSPGHERPANSNEDKKNSRNRQQQPQIKYLVPSAPPSPCAEAQIQSQKYWVGIVLPPALYLSSVGLLSSQHLSLKRQTAGRQNLSKVKENFSQGAIRRISPSPKVQSRYLHSSSFVWTKEAASLDIAIKPPALNSLLFLNDHRLAIEKDFRTSSPPLLPPLPCTHTLSFRPLPFLPWLPHSPRLLSHIFLPGLRHNETGGLVQSFSPAKMECQL
ncbi:hypothetical protein E2320_016231 [Naja naja]|nr:hypothetical protein E2320_016231 [Naja naja]